MSNNLQKQEIKSNLIKSEQTRTDLSKFNLEALNKSLSSIELPRLFYQLVIFIIDGSGSMTRNGISGETKGKEVAAAVKKVFQRLLKSKNKNSFDVSMWAFAEENVEVIPVTSVCNVNIDKTLDPCDYINLNQSTELRETLVCVKKISEEYLANNHDKNSQVLLIILSDGAIHDVDDIGDLVDEIKKNKRITIDAIYFEDKIWSEDGDIESVLQMKLNLKSLASNDDTFYTSSIDPEQIRKHMIKSISIVSKVDDIQ